MITSENPKMNFYRDTFKEKGYGSLRSPKCPIVPNRTHHSRAKRAIREYNFDPCVNEFGKYL